jgi:phosphatidylserine synthase 2
LHAKLQALIIRDNALLWVLSIGFELMELTFQHMLPNFNECWWDSWVLDVAVCNFVGEEAAMLATKVAHTALKLGAAGHVQKSGHSPSWRQRMLVLNNC